MQILNYFILEILYSYINGQRKELEKCTEFVRIQFQAILESDCELTREERSQAKLINETLLKLGKNIRRCSITSSYIKIFHSNILVNDKLYFRNALQ